MKLKWLQYLTIAFLVFLEFLDLQQQQVDKDQLDLCNQKQREQFHRFDWFHQMHWFWKDERNQWLVAVLVALKTEKDNWASKERKGRSGDGRENFAQFLLRVDCRQDRKEQNQQFSFSSFVLLFSSLLLVLLQHFLLFVWMSATNNPPFIRQGQVQHERSPLDTLSSYFWTAANVVTLFFQTLINVRLLFLASLFSSFWFSRVVDLISLLFSFFFIFPLSAICSSAVSPFAIHYSSSSSQSCSWLLSRRFLCSFWFGQWIVSTSSSIRRRGRQQHSFRARSLSLIFSFKRVSRGERTKLIR